MLDDDERDAGTVDVAHEIDGELHLALALRPGHGLVEQQHLRLGRQRAGDLQPLAAGRAERARRRVRKPAHADALQHRARPGLGLGAMRGAQEGADHDVLQHRHAFKGLRHLERAGKPEPRALLRREVGDVVPLEQHAARGGLEIAGQAIEEGGFAGAVRADQAENIALLQRDGRIVHRLEAAERLCDVARLKEHGRLPRSLAPALAALAMSRLSSAGCRRAGSARSAR